jgi:hypothetical protein
MSLMSSSSPLGDENKDKPTESDNNKGSSVNTSAFIHNFDLFNYTEADDAATTTPSSGEKAKKSGLENSQNNPMLSHALSPNSDSNRSHDGVFLKPGAVYTRWAKYKNLIMTKNK